MAPREHAARRSGDDRAFFGAFAVYALVAVGLLLLGLLSVAVDASPALSASLEGWIAAGGALAPLWTAVLEASAHTHGGAHTAVDYLFSALNLGLGLLILWLRPDNWTARLLAVGLVGTAAAFNLESHALFFVAFDTSPAIVNGLHFVLHAVSGAAFLHALLAFPDGRLTRRWARRLVAVVWTGVAIDSTVSLIIGIGPLGALGMLPIDLVVDLDPLEGVAAVSTADALFFVIFFGMVVPAVGAAAQVHRYRTAMNAEEAQQSRILVWALVLAFGIGLAFTAVAVGVGVRHPDPLAFIHQIEGVVFRVFAPLFAIIPIAIIVGVVRYRLWDVDVVINRTLVYTLLTGTLAVAYIAAVTVFGLLLAPVTEQVGGDLVPVLATATVALLFLPLRRRIQGAIDRRLYRRRYDAVRAVDDLADRLRTEADLEAVCGDVLKTIETTVQPDRAIVWLDPERVR